MELMTSDPSPSSSADDGVRERLGTSGPESAPQALTPAAPVELLRSLGRLVRGLSALFWGLPLGLLAVVLGAAPPRGLEAGALINTVKSLGMAPALAVNGLLLFGLWQLSSFQRQERIWIQALDRARLLGLVNLGLCPFLAWWNRFPNASFFAAAVLLLCLSSLLFLYNLNLVVLRLTAMLPDETLRTEARFFTVLNGLVLLAILLAAAGYVTVSQIPAPALPRLTPLLVILRDSGTAHWIFMGLVFLTLLPVATTMALLWKTKEVILSGVFGPH
jgi:hypothetical protein